MILSDEKLELDWTEKLERKKLKEKGHVTTKKDKELKTIHIFINDQDNGAECTLSKGADIRDW